MKSYWLRNKHILFILSSLFIVLGLLSWIYQLPFELLLYAYVLVLLISSIFMYLDYQNYRQDELQIKENMHNLEHKLAIKKLNDPLLIQASQLIERYRALNDELELQHQHHQSEMLDYYTMWVHQIKTPIFALEMLCQQDEIQTELVNIELLKIEQYVDMVLSYLRLGSSSNDLYVSKFKLDEVCKASFKKYAPLFIYKKIKLTFESNDLMIVSDKKWLQVVIEQILANSIKYSKNQGEIKVVITEDGVEITDYGIGIHDFDLPKLFEKGYTGFNGRVSRQASGLGLYLSKQILDKLGHQIKIESVVNQMTKVTITFDEKQRNLTRM